jgi:hypothetical protein
MALAKGVFLLIELSCRSSTKHNSSLMVKVVPLAKVTVGGTLASRSGACFRAGSLSPLLTPKEQLAYFPGDIHPIPSSSAFA